MKIIYVAGYKALNLGDDLFFKILFDRYPDVRFIMSAPMAYKTIFGQYGNVIIHPNLTIWSRIVGKCSAALGIHKNHYRELKYIARNYSVDAVVTIGGSIFIESEQRPSIHYDTFLAYKNYFAGKPIFYLGCNFGPYRTEAFKDTIRKIFEGASDVCFRDRYSYELFQDISSTRVANDVVFSLKYDNLCKKKKEFGISLIDLSQRAGLAGIETRYIDKMVDLIGYYSKKGYKVKLFSFCKSEGDEKAIEKITGKLPHPDKIRIIKYDGDFSQMLHELKSLEYIVASRFHAMILGFIFSIKVFPLAYNNKTSDLLKSYGKWCEIYKMDRFIDLDNEEIDRSFIESIPYDATENRPFDKLDSFVYG